MAVAAKRIRPKIVSSNVRTRGEWVVKITAAWQDSLKSIFETGNLLEAAKLELAHGEWLKMVKDELPFTRTVATRLIQITDNDNVRNDAHVHHLPVSWGTLYELTKLDAETFTAAIKDGRINPKMQRKDAAALRGKTKSKNRKEQPPRSPGSNCFFTVADELRHVVAQNVMTPDDRETLFRDLRALLDQLEEQATKDEQAAR